MAIGGGTFLTQNKILPGAYINFVSTAQASAALSDRGVASIPLQLDWGAENQMFTVELNDFLKNSLEIFGYPYTAEQLKPAREIFKHAKTVHFFRLNSGGTKASNSFATAKYPGKRGDDIKIIIEANEKSSAKSPLFDVCARIDKTVIFKQEGVSAASELIDNDFLIWKKDAVLALTVSTPLTGGTTGEVTDVAFQEYLDQIEKYNVNAIGCTSTDLVIVKLFTAFVERMRDDAGKKFQAVVFNHLADNEGVVSLKNGLKDARDDPALIPWVTGVIAGTAVNRSATNLVYDGEYEPDTHYTQAELENAIKEGSFMLHTVGASVRVLDDINTFVSITDEKSADFSSNQTIRVLDQIANDIAVLFASKYLGKVPNDAAGRISLWNDIVKHHSQLQSVRAIQNFSSADVTVQQGDTKKSVVVTDYVTPVNAMTQLYMTVYVQ